MKTLHQVPNQHSLEVFYKGPCLDKGALPAVFYFSISAKESLSLPPFCHYINYLEKNKSGPCRFFSITLPFHQEPLPKEEAIGAWVDSIKDGVDPLSPFISSASNLIEDLFEQNLLIKNKIVLCGLSRGTLIALLVASKQPLCRSIIGLAPLLDLKACKESKDLENHPLLDLLSAFHVKESLIHKKILFFIGNRDLRVGTQKSVDLVCSLADLAHEKRQRGGSFKLIIDDSIGYLGHGTSDETFEKAALSTLLELFSNEL